MVDPKAVAEAMDYVIEHVTRAYGMACGEPADDHEAVLARVAAELGYAIGAATAVKLQCERAGKPTMRGAAE